jgi:DHA1 family multidrug resistance protein-like MFS transporter
MRLIKKRLDLVQSWQRTLYIMFIAQFMVAVGFSSIFPFLPFYVEELGTNTNLSLELLSGLVYSSQAFTMMIAAPIWGMLADRMGRKLMVERAMFGGAVLLFLMAFARSAEHVVILRAVQGMVTGTVAAANALVAGEAPRKHMGYAMGFLQVGFGAGLAIGPLIGGAVADALGYSETFYVTAAMLLIAGFLVLFGIHENFQPGPKNAAKQSDGKSHWKSILTANGVLATYGMGFLASLARMVVIPIIPLFVELLLTNPDRLNTFTGLVMGVASASTTASAVYFGRLGDKFGHRQVLILCSFVAGLLYLPQVFVISAWQLMVLQVLVGIAVGGIIPTVSALLARYTKPGEEGLVYGLDNSINAAGRAIAPLLGAWVATVFGVRATFTATMLIFLCSGLLASIYLPKLGVDELSTADA